MDGTCVCPNQRSFGHITIEDAEELCLRPTRAPAPLQARRYKCTWRPPQPLQEHLPPGFELPLQCVIGPDKLRRFYPWTTFETFLALASCGGLAILCQRQGLDAHQRHSYRAMRLLFLRARRMNEFFRHEFDHGRDLTIVAAGRDDPTEKDILPDDLGLDARGRGRRWGEIDVIRRGAAAARAAGYARPTSAQCIQYGLHEAARLNPLPIANHKAVSLVRATLFSQNLAEDPDPEVLEIVTERTLDALNRHLLDNADRFAKWFWGPKSSFIHQISKQKRSRGGPLEEEEVRQALIHLGWRTYDYASNCIHAQMRIIQNALPEPLTAQERLLFEHLHQRQEYLGNLPLVLLVQRFQFLKGALWQLWESLPDLGSVPVLHRLLDYFATMAAKRREADRRIKNGRPAPFIEEAYVPPEEGDFFQEIAAEIREVQGIDCHCPRRDWHAELRGKGEAKIHILHQCMACAFEMETTVNRQEFASLGQAIQ